MKIFSTTDPNGRTDLASIVTSVDEKYYPANKRSGHLTGVTPNGTTYWIYPDTSLTPATEAQTKDFMDGLKLIAEKKPGALISKGSQFSSGADPEVFVKVDGKVIPSWTFLNEKGKWNGYTSAYVDGVQAEFGVAIRTCHAYLVDEFRAGLNKIYTAACKNFPTAELTHECVVDASHILADCTDEQAGLGCTPSLNVYGEPPLGIDNPRDLGIRFAGCHYHYGIGKVDEGMADQLVRAADAVAGVASVSLLHGLEDARRRMFYGKAGEYRLPKHGIEYRTFSSAALRHPVCVHLLFDLVRSTMGTATILPHEVWWNADEDDVRACINELDVRLARRILAKNEKMLRRLFGLSYMYGAGDKAFDLISLGINNLIELPDMETAWRLSGADEGWVGHSEGQNCSVAKFNRKSFPKAKALIRKENRAALLKKAKAGEAA